MRVDMWSDSWETGWWDVKHGERTESIGQENEPNGVLFDSFSARG